MKIIELLGKSIRDIQVAHFTEQGGLDTAESYLILDNGIVAGIPWSDCRPDDELWMKETTAKAETIKKLLKKTYIHLLNQPITDLITYHSEIKFDKAFIELGNGYLISEITIAPPGLGDTGLWYFESIHFLEAEFGGDYTRLTHQKENI